MVALSSANAQTLEDGLVTYYPFNGNADDESGNDNNGTLSNASLTTDRFGKGNSALLITGNDGGATSANNIRISGNADRTISFWCKSSNSTGTRHPGAGWGNSSRPGGRFYFSENFDLGMWLWGHYADIDYPVSGAPYDQWRHLVFVYKSSLNDAVCYVDGIVVPRDGFGKHNTTSTLNTIETTLRAFGSEGDFIDDVRVYNRALSGGEVNELYNFENSEADWSQSTFEIVEGDFTWEEAKADAEARGGRLAVLDTSAQVDVAYSYLDSVGTWPFLWLGASDAETEDIWKWLNGVILDALNPKWKGEEGPNNNNNNPDGEDSLFIFSSDSGDNAGLWGDGDFNGISYLLELSAPDPNDGLVAYYPFNGNAEDESGNGNNATVDGATLTTDRNGNADSAYALNGTDGNISSADGDHLNFADGNMTLAVWFKYTDGARTGPIIGQSGSDGSVKKWEIFYNEADKKFYYHVSDHGVGPAYWLTGTDFTDDGQWHQIIYTKNGSDYSSYLDGQHMATQEGPVVFPNAEAEFSIGSPESLTMRGSLDDVRIYNRALSGEEVSELYDLEKSTIPNPDPSPPVLTLEQFYEALPDETITIDATPESGFPEDFTYQWYFGTFLIPGVLGGNDSSRIIDANEDNNGLWRVVVSNSEGSAESIFNFAAYADTDGDGISDGREEFVIGSDPTLADTDGDGIKDYDEVYTYGTSFSKADTDGDGFDDLFEINTKYDPLNQESTPEAYLDIQTAVELKFNAAKDLNYKIENSVDLENWSAIETGVLGKGGLIKRLYSIDDYPGRYFRVKRE